MQICSRTNSETGNIFIFKKSKERKNAKKYKASLGLAWLIKQVFLQKNKENICWGKYLFSQQKDKIGIRCIYSCTRVILSVNYIQKIKDFWLICYRKNICYPINCESIRWSLEVSIPK